MKQVTQVVFKQFDKFWITDIVNYNRIVRDASKIKKLDGFNNFDEVANYMYQYCGITRDCLIDKTNE